MHANVCLTECLLAHAKYFGQKTNGRAIGDLTYPGPVSSKKNAEQTTGPLIRALKPNIAVRLHSDAYAPPRSLSPCSRTKPYTAAAAI